VTQGQTRADRASDILTRADFLIIIPLKALELTGFYPAMKSQLPSALTSLAELEGRGLFTG
jgi:hypothetical protein